MKREDIKRKSNIEKLSKVIEEKKQIPKNIKENITSNMFENIIFAVIIIIYLSALSIGMVNIPTENYLVDLKVFSIFLLVVTIMLFELAYKKDKSELWLHGVEIMVVRSIYYISNTFIFYVLQFFF